MGSATTLRVYARASHSLICLESRLGLYNERNYILMLREGEEITVAVSSVRIKFKHNRF